MTFQGCGDGRTWGVKSFDGGGGKDGMQRDWTTTTALA